MSFLFYVIFILILLVVWMTDFNEIYCKNKLTCQSCERIIQMIILIPNYISTTFSKFYIFKDNWDECEERNYWDQQSSQKRGSATNVHLWLSLWLEVSLNHFYFGISLFKAYAIHCLLELISCFSYDYLIWIELRLTSEIVHLEYL